MKHSATPSRVIERHLNSQERSLVHVMLLRNLQYAAEITKTLSRKDVQTGHMTEAMYHILERKIQALEEGLQAIGHMAGIAPNDRDALDDLGKIPSIIRIQAC